MMRTGFTLSTILVVLALPLCSTPQQFLLGRVNADASASQAGKAQVITEDVAGLHRVIITTSRSNKIFVNLPDDMAEGDTISGTVFAEGAGMTDAERATNLLELKDQFIEIAGQTVPATGGQFTATLTLGAGNLPKPNPNPKPPCLADTLPCAVTSPPPLSPLGFPVPYLSRYCFLLRLCPPGTFKRIDAKFHYGQVGQFIEVPGPFNGVIAPTDYVRIGGQEMKLLAESPRKTVFFNTSTVIGPTEIEVSEDGKVQKGQFRNLSLSMSALKYDLRKGERTKLHVVVKGLDNLQEEIPLRLENRSTNILSMENGNIQTLTIRPKDVKPGGVYETERTLIGIQVGAFFIEGIVTWSRR